MVFGCRLLRHCRRPLVCLSSSRPFSSKPPTIAIETIDMQQWVSTEGDPAGRKAMASHILQSLHLHGFLYLKNVPSLPLDLVINTLRQCQGFFGQPLAVKQSCSTDTHSRGYFNFLSVSGHRDMIEAFNAGPEVKQPALLRQPYFDQLYEGVPGHEEFWRPPMEQPNRWPIAYPTTTSPPSTTTTTFSVTTATAAFSPPPVSAAGFQDAMHTYFLGCQALTCILLEAAELDCGLEQGSFSSLASFHDHVLEAKYYPPINLLNNTDSKTLRFAEHTDMTLFTVLVQDVEQGLQVFDEAQQQWYTVPARPDCVLINSGEFIRSLTGLPACKHRVCAESGVYHHARVSLVFFAIPDWHATLKPTPLSKFLQKNRSDGRLESMDKAGGGEEQEYQAGDRMPF